MEVSCHGLVHRLFRTDRKPASRLGDFLSKITPGAIQAQALAVKDPELRIPTAISLLVLEQSGRFTRELFAALAEPPVPVSTPLGGAARFDAVAFETAAFVHYSLLAKHLGSPHDELENDDGSDDDDPYFVAVRDASQLTASILGSLVAFGVNEQIFVNRPLAYSMRARRQGFVEMFEGILIEAIESASPATLRARGVSLDLGLSLVVSLRARAFALTMLPAFGQVARNAVEKAADLGFD